MRRDSVASAGIIANMDAALEKRWKAAEGPFDGITLHDVGGEIPLAKLREAAARVLDLLEARYAEAGLLILDDWHEHDGFVNAGTKTSWHALRDRLSDDDAFLYFKTGDPHVAKAVYPDGMQFLLRVCIEEDSGSDSGTGSMDVTVPAGLRDVIAAALTQSGLAPSAMNAKAFFDERYGG
jgi:hypothetical protein